MSGIPFPPMPGILLPVVSTMNLAITTRGGGPDGPSREKLARFVAMLLEFLGRRAERGATETDELELLTARETTSPTVEEVLP